MRAPQPETRVLTSSSTFVLGEKLKLRPDMGGGWWEVVEVLPRIKLPFCRALVRRIEKP
jgi:hypothetical protein